ncbi:acyltransferase [Armatimonas sp.]|uniref:acyltransferase n=1 Tax=Armatimonas sp. TaxID=1872638 RepID=UPI00286BF4DF|nr:acyltransferase [Armatimonas sp.]
MSLFAKIIFRVRHQLSLVSFLNCLRWQVLGAKIGAGTSLASGATMNWPHQVSMGRQCLLEQNIDFKFSKPYELGPAIRLGNEVFVGRNSEFNITKGIEIGDYCLIASGCKFIDHDHGVLRGEFMYRQVGPEAPIRLEKDVWLGVNVTVLKGVTIGEGAIVAAGAVVNKDIPPYEIWGGIPAKKLRDRPSAD